jgi:pimeloyl-ACP methyl ester carboxylesterase
VRKLTKSSFRMAPITPFVLDVPQARLDLLEKKLALTELPDELEGAGWAYGAPLGDIKRLLDHWQNRYSWRAEEARINATLPQYTTPVTVDGFDPIDVHFVWQRSDIPNAIPLLFVHGWPGHFLEVERILPALVQGSKDFPAFHVIAPSLPNYGFSEGVKKKGFGPRQYAETCHKLMLNLGYDKYVTQGGDWGAVFTRVIGILYPEHCMASHVNMAHPFEPKWRNHPFLKVSFSAQKLFGLSADDKAGVARGKWFNKEASGYHKEQSTKPQTIGYSQVDSPVGLLAWIYEKLHDWTDSYPWADDEVLTWISIYLFSRAGAHAPSRTYYEFRNNKEGWQYKVNQWVPKVKLGVGRFPKELSLPPKIWYGTMGNLVFLSQHKSGGHFAAFEKPDAIIDDLRKMFGKKGGAYRCVPGASGYVDLKLSAKL